MAETYKEGIDCASLTQQIRGVVLVGVVVVVVSTSAGVATVLRQGVLIGREAQG